MGYPPTATVFTATTTPQQSTPTPPAPIQDITKRVSPSFSPTGPPVGPPSIKPISGVGAFNPQAPLNPNAAHPPASYVVSSGGSGAPPGYGSNGNYGAPPSSGAGSTPRTIGPPAIRPFGLSTAHIVSGKSSSNGHYRIGSNATLSAMSGGPNRNVNVAASAHQSGYDCR